MNTLVKRIFLWKSYKNILWLIFLLGISIRLYNLGSHNLWFDEIASFVYSNRLSSCQLLFHTSHGCNLYYILLKPWVMCFGSSEFSLRFLSMMFGSFSVLLIYRLGKELFNIKSGLLSAFILSISPIHIWYSQEARAYSLLIFLIMLIVYIYILALKKNKLYLWMSFVGLSILGLTTDSMSLFIIILTGMLFFPEKRKSLLVHYVVSLIFVAVAFLLFFPALSYRISGIINNYWIPKPHLDSVVITFENFNVGYNATLWIYLFTFIIFSLLFILGIKCWWQEKRKELISLISFLFIPIIFTYLISQRMPIYLDRQLMLFSPFYYIIIAAGLARIKMRSIEIAVYLSILLPNIFCLHNYFSYRLPLSQHHYAGSPVKKPVKPAADYINKRFIKGDAIGYSEPTDLSLFYYLNLQKIASEKIDIFVFVIRSKLDKYWRGCGEKYGYGRYLDMPLPSRRVIILNEERSSKSLEQYNFRRLWLISSSWARNGILNLHAQSVRDWMRIHYSLLESREFDGIFIDLYCPNVDLVVK